MSVFQHIALVCNPKADTPKGFQFAEKIGQILKAKGLRYTLYATDWPANWAGFSTVWLIGGDGTLNYFINTYPDINVPLSIFPAGTGNDFAWMLYQDMNVDNQTEKILSSAPQSVDAGICNGKLFLNGVGIGFDGAIVKDLLGKKKLAGKSSYMLSVLKNIVAFSEKECVIKYKSEEIKQHILMLSVANGRRYGGGFTVAPRAELADGLLDLNIVGKIDAFQRVRYLPVIEKGEHLNLHFVKYDQVTDVTIEFDKEIPAHLDGEFLSARQFNIRILPNRFHFL